MWLSRNNANRGGDTFYVLCTHKPTELIARGDQAHVQFVDNNRQGITYSKIPPHLFEASHPNLILKPGEGPYWVGLEKAEIPPEARGNPMLDTG